MWLEVDEDLPEHPKSLRLCAALMNPLGWAYVIKLWRWCCKYAPDGDLTEFGAEEIEYGLGWTLDAGKLYAALKTARFIEDTEDGRVLVHDWMEHQGRAIKKMEKDAKRKRLSRRARPTDVQRTSNGRRQDVRVTAPVPNPTQPNLTKLDQTRSGESAARPSERSSPPPAPQGSPVEELTFPCDGAPATWWVTREQLAEWQRLYPHLDVLGECRKALAWIKANESKRKTAGGMPRYLVKWLNRAQDTGGSGALSGARGSIASARRDANCAGWHAGGKNTGRKNPRGRQDGCPECKSIDLREWTSETRQSEPTPIGAVTAQGGRT
jgi:hypothetical protein